jgi:hypothetical protein
LVNTYACFVCSPNCPSILCTRRAKLTYSKLCPVHTVSFIKLKHVAFKRLSKRALTFAFACLSAVVSHLSQLLLLSHLTSLISSQLLPLSHHTTIAELRRKERKKHHHQHHSKRNLPQSHTENPTQTPKPVLTESHTPSKTHTTKYQNSKIIPVQYTHNFKSRKQKQKNNKVNWDG